MHRNKINGKVYIGLTHNIPERRWCKGNGYINNTHFYNAIKKYGWENGFEHIILKDGLSLEEAQKMEIDTIEKYDSTNQDKGYNILRGGDLGTSKYVYQYDKKTGKFIRKWNSGLDAAADIGVVDQCIYSSCNGLSKGTASYYYSYEDYGDILPEDLIEYINSDGNWKEVAQYDLDGNYIAKYKSIEEASSAVNVERITLYTLTSAGYIWRIISDLDRDYTLPLSKEEVERVYVNGNSKEVYQYDLSGKFLRSWAGMRIAARELNISNNIIASACKGQKFKTAGGYIWRDACEYEYGKDLSEEEVIKLTTKSNSFGISQYTLDGDFVQWFPSISKASTITGIHNSSIRCAALKINNYKSAGGYIWVLDKDALDMKSKKKKQSKPRKICKYDLDGNLIEVFPSMKSAARSIGHSFNPIKSCCDGRKESYDGYKWKYAD